MDPSGSQQNNLKGEKENDKLLAQADSKSGHCYGNAGEKAAAEAVHSMEGTSLSSSITNRLTPPKTSKDKYLKSLAEEDVPKANCKKKALKVVVTVLFIIIVVGIVIIWTFHEGRSKKHIGNQYFDFIAKKRVLNIYSNKNGVKLSGNIRVTDCDIGKLKNCYDEETKSNFCFIFSDGAIFRFRLYDLGVDKNVHCADIIWENMQPQSFAFTDCYEIDYGSWYGLPNFVSQFWPIKVEESMEELSYQPFSDEKLGHILEAFWINTNGIAIAAHQHVPIKIDLTKQDDSGYGKKLCVSLDQKDFKIPKKSFNYSICSGPDIKQTFLAARNAYLPKSPVLDIENHDFGRIVWKYENKGQTTAGFGKFLNKLNTLGLPIHTVQCDSNWEEHIGDFKFHGQARDEFTQYLKGKYSNAKLILPISLACSYLSDNFRVGGNRDLFAKDVQTGAVKMVLLKNQSCALWDTSYPITKAFLRELMDLLQQKGTLEENVYPQGFEFQTVVNSHAFPISLYENTSEVNAINLNFAEFLLSMNKSLLMHSAFHMQNLHMFVEIPTEVANVKGKKCLDYTIPAALTAGIHGYPYVMSTAPSEDIVDHELYMRWLQLAAFFPGIKVTNAVTKFEEQTAELAKIVSTFREDIVLPLLQKASKDVARGIPIIRPLWWIQPLDYNTYHIADQFLLGDTVVVAPVLCHGDRKRDIYLPAGKWVSTKTGKAFTGRQWIRNFEIPLNELPFFERYNKSVHTQVDNPP